MDKGKKVFSKKEIGGNGRDDFATLYCPICMDSFRLLPIGYRKG